MEKEIRYCRMEPGWLREFCETPEMQRLMEHSALVIIDVDDAIALGYAKLNGTIRDMIGEDGGDAE